MQTREEAEGVKVKSSYGIKACFSLLWATRFEGESAAVENAASSRFQQLVNEKPKRTSTCWDCRSDFEGEVALRGEGKGLEG